MGISTTKYVIWDMLFSFVTCVRITDYQKEWKIHNEPTNRKERRALSKNKG